MFVYVGQSRSEKLIPRLEALGFGECTQPYEWPPRRSPCFFDNGAFANFKKGKAFDGVKYQKALAKVQASGIKPDFLPVPDLVGGGLKSLEMSLSWVPTVRELGPSYLVVQEGMSYTAVAGVLSQFGGIFVGGASLDWKWETAHYWVQLAHCHGLPCHIGRVGTGKRVRMALASGCDSIDSCVPLMSEENLQAFIRPLGLVNKRDYKNV